VSLPTSRDTTYVPGNVVQSANLNNIQDAIIALHLNAHLTSRSRTIWCNEGFAETGSSGVWSIDAQQRVINTTSVTAGNDWILPLVMSSGMTATVKAIVRHPTLAVAGAIDIYIADADESGTINLSSAASSAATTAWQSVTVTTGLVVPTGKAYFLRFRAAAGGIADRLLQHVRIDYTTP